MAPLPVFRFPSSATHFQFSNSSVNLFVPFYKEDKKGNLEKHYGLIFTCLITIAVHLGSCPDLNTGTFLNAFRRFTSRGYQNCCTVIMERNSSERQKSAKNVKRALTTTKFTKHLQLQTRLGN